MRIPQKPSPDDSNWVGSLVCYRPRGGGGNGQIGRVVRMASSRTAAAFVLYEGETQPKFTYCADLEKAEV